MVTKETIPANQKLGSSFPASLLRIYFTFPTDQWKVILLFPYKELPYIADPVYVGQPVCQVNLFDLQ